MKDKQLIKIIDYIDPSKTSYEEWLAIGMAMHHEGYSWEDWDSWSMGDSRYVEGDCERRWQGFNDNKGQIVTAGTIVEIAKRQGYRFATNNSDPGIALSWDSSIIQEKEFRFIDEGWVEDVEIHEPKNWNPNKQLITYLEELFEPSEYVGFNVKSMTRIDKEGKKKLQPADSGVYFKTAGELIQDLRKYNEIEWVIGDYNKAAGAWIRFNPLDGKGVKNENVTSYRYALIESDNMDIEQQLALIKELQLPCKAIVSSAGKSIHAIVHVGANSYPEYQKKVEYIYQVCEANGFALDKANKNPSRLSRLPGAERNGKKQFIIETNTGKGSFEEWQDWIEDINDDMGDIEELPEEDIRPILAPELIKGILRNGHKMLVSGPSKAGKSFLLLQLGLAIARGEEWIGQPCRKGKVLYVNLELDPRSAVARVYDILEQDGLSFSAVRDNFMIWNLRGKAVPMDRLSKKLIRRTEKYKFDAVIIDPIYKVLTGDENNAKDMADFTNQFDKIATQMDCAVIYCHHHSKGYQGQKKSMDRASGSGVFARDPDAILDLTELEIQDSERDEYALASGQSAWRIECTLREFATPEPIDIYFKYPIHEVDDKGLLQELTPEVEKPAWQRGNEKSTATKQKKSEKQFEQFEMEFASYTSFHQVESMPLEYMLKKENVGERAMRNRINKYEGYYIKNSKIYKTE